MSLTVGSTFTGVGGADLGLEAAGFTITWQCELDAWKRSVLEAHWPSVTIYPDITQLDNPPPVDLLIGGFPCQDLSVAGKRKGFTGERSVLAFDFLRIAESLRPRWLLMENVPGLLSSNNGRDLARLLDEVGTIGYGWAYRILDARYFGVPQRRRRIFIVARRADPQLDTRAAAKLALRALWEGSSGDPTPGWPPRALTPTSTKSSTQSGGSVGTHGAADQHPTGTLTRMYAEQSGQDFGGGRSRDASRIYNATAAYGAWQEGAKAGTLSQRDYKSTNHLLVDGGGQPQCSAYRKSRRAASMTDDETWVEADHANTINTFDVGDTRTTHAIVAHGVSASDDQVAGTLCTNSQGGQRTTDIAAAEVDRSPALTQIKSERGIHVTHTLTSAGHDASEDGTGRGTPIVAATLTSGSHPNSNAPGRRNEDDVNLVGQQMSVRRLTPTECERLMGWPDDWTAPEGIKAPDSKRYAACGDGIVSHVAYWIGCRIQMIEDES